MGCELRPALSFGLLANGKSHERILQAYPYWESADIDAVGVCGMAARGTRGAVDSPISVQLIIDMNLSVEWVDELTSHGS